MIIMSTVSCSSQYLVNGEITYNSNTSTASYQCNNGYTLSGVADNIVERICDKDTMQWRPEEPAFTCERKNFQNVCLV